VPRVHQEASAASWLESWHRGRLLERRPGHPCGHERIAAGLLILAGGGRGIPLDYDELERWTRVGYEGGVRSRKGER
jgi:hypothetical protein